MANEKAREKTELAVAYGILMQPLEEVVTQASEPSKSDYRIAIAKVKGGDRKWRGLVSAFARFTDDISFDSEGSDISHVPEVCRREIMRVINGNNTDESKLQKIVKVRVNNARTRFFDLIECIPVNWQPTVFEANTPFTAYLCLVDAIRFTKTRLDYFDRYLKVDFFELFLSKIDSSTEVRLITTAGNNQYGVGAVTTLANLAKNQFANFQLIQVSPADMHDRNLRVDDQFSP